MYLRLCSTSYVFVFHKKFRLTSQAITAIPFFDSKITTFSFERQHNQAHFVNAQRKLVRSFYMSYQTWILKSTKQQKEGNSDGSMGSKSKMNLMKSYKINKKEAEQKLKKQKKENALDIISKSIFKPFWMVQIGKY